MGFLLLALLSVATAEQESVSAFLKLLEEKSEYGSHQSLPPANKAGWLQGMNNRHGTPWHGGYEDGNNWGINGIGGIPPPTGGSAPLRPPGRSVLALTGSPAQPAAGSAAWSLARNPPVYTLGGVQAGLIEESEHEREADVDKADQPGLKDTIAGPPSSDRTAEVHAALRLLKFAAKRGKKGKWGGMPSDGLQQSTSALPAAWQTGGPFQGANLRFNSGWHSGYGGGMQYGGGIPPWDPTGAKEKALNGGGGKR